MNENDNIEKKIFYLRKKIEKYNYYYYNLHYSLITDQEYDKIFIQLQKLEEKYPEYSNIHSPTKKIGHIPNKKFELIFHKKPMLSLKSIFSSKDLESFIKNIAKKINCDIDNLYFVCEPKFDGVAINLIYKYGILTYAVTRGDGKIGENVINNVITIYNIPKVLHIKEKLKFLEVHGEIYISKKKFIHYNKIANSLNDRVFMNPRNAASGYLRSIHKKYNIKNLLSILCYDIGECDGMLLPDSHFKRLNLLKSLGFPISKQNALVSGITKCLNYYYDLQNTRIQLPYEIDGVVYKINCIDIQKKLGYASKYPKYSCAYKFSSITQNTIIKAINFQIGRTGIITPVADIDPVNIDGTTINKVTLHNVFEIKRKNIHIGDNVVIQRIGHVIPKIISVNPNGVNRSKIVFPTKCPICKSNIEYKNSIARCTGKLLCTEQLKQKIIHFSSKRAMNIYGFGPELIDKLIKNKYITNICDIYNLNINNLCVLQRINKKLAEKIIISINNSKKTTLSRFLYALGINGVGENTAKILSSFKNIYELQNISFDKLITIKNIGKICAKNIVYFFSQEDNWIIINNMIDYGVHFIEEMNNSII